MRASRSTPRTAKKSRRWWAVFAAPLLVFLPLAGACNALTGEHDRFLDDGDAGRQPGRPPRPVDAPSDTTRPVEEVDSGGREEDAGLTITIGTTWSSPNGAKWAVDGGVTTITEYDANHPILVPLPQPSIPSDSYTVRATIRAPANGEFGIVARVQSTNSAAVLLASRFGTENYPWIGTIAPPEWNPDRLANGASYTFKPTRYRFWLNVSGRLAQGKMWEADQPEPPVQVTATIPWATGRGVGLYQYLNGGDAMFEELEVTVP
jgi:hypothetical protein